MAKVPDIETGSVEGASQYVPLSEDALKELALADMHGAIFGTWHIPEHDAHLIANIFMVVVFLSDIERKRLRRDDIVHFYQWGAEALPTGINGYPMFMSALMLDSSDAKRLSIKKKQIAAVLEAI